MRKNLYLNFAILLSLAFLIPLVYAQVSIPHQFWGTVTYNSVSAPNGVSIVAKIDGVNVKEAMTLDGKYGYNPLFMITDPNGNRAGEVVTFFVNGVEAGTFVFSNGETTELNLIASGPEITSPSPPPVNTGGNNGGGSSGGGGGGSGGGGGGGAIVKKTTSASCTPSWQCSDWLDCIGTVQKRVCTDVNACGTNEGKPAEEQACESVELRQSRPFLSRILGAVVGPSGNIRISGVIILVVIVLAIGAFLMYKRKAKNKLGNISQFS